MFENGVVVIVGAVIGSGAWDSAKVADQMYHLDPDCEPFAG